MIISPLQKAVTPIVLISALLLPGCDYSTLIPGGKALDSQEAKGNLDRIFAGVEGVSSVKYFHTATDDDWHIYFYRFRASPEVASSFIKANDLKILANESAEKSSFARGFFKESFEALDEIPPRWWVKRAALEENKIRVNAGITRSLRAFFFYSEKSRTAYIIVEQLWRNPEGHFPNRVRSAVAPQP